MRPVAVEDRQADSESFIEATASSEAARFCEGVGKRPAQEVAVSADDKATVVPSSEDSQDVRASFRDGQARLSVVCGGGCAVSL